MAYKKSKVRSKRKTRKRKSLPSKYPYSAHGSFDNYSSSDAISDVSGDRNNLVENAVNGLEKKYPTTYMAVVVRGIALEVVIKESILKKAIAIANAEAESLIKEYEKNEHTDWGDHKNTQNRVNQLEVEIKMMEGYKYKKKG